MSSMETDEPAPGSKAYPQFLLFGDSITEQSTDPTLSTFHSSLQNLYIRRLDIINRGLSGYNTAHAIRILHGIVPNPAQARVRILYIFFGANDAALPGTPSKQHVPLETYKSNLRHIVSHGAVAAHEPRIVLITPPPVDENLLVESGFGDKGREAAVTARYAMACREVAGEMGVACCDLWTVLMEYACGGNEIPDLLPGDRRAPRNERLNELLSDGLHFRRKAYELMFEAVRKTIFENFEELRPENMESVLPAWGEAPKGVLDAGSGITNLLLQV